MNEEKQYNIEWRHEKQIWKFELSEKKDTLL